MHGSRQSLAGSVPTRAAGAPLARVVAPGGGFGAATAARATPLPPTTLRRASARIDVRARAGGANGNGEQQQQDGAQGPAAPSAAPTNAALPPVGAAAAAAAAPASSAAADIEGPSTDPGVIYQRLVQVTMGSGCSQCGRLARHRAFAHRVCTRPAPLLLVTPGLARLFLARRFCHGFSQPRPCVLARGSASLGA